MSDLNLDTACHNKFKNYFWNLDHVHVSWSALGKCEDGVCDMWCILCWLQMESNACLIRPGKSMAVVQGRSAAREWMTEGWCCLLYRFVFSLILHGGDSYELLCFVSSLLELWIIPGCGRNRTNTWTLLCWLCWSDAVSEAGCISILVGMVLFMIQWWWLLLLQSCLLWRCYLCARRGWGLNAILAVCCPRRGKKGNLCVCVRCVSRVKWRLC